MDAVEFLAVHEPLVALHVPGDVAGLGHDLFVVGGCEEALFRLVEVALVFERQESFLFASHLDREL
jgi:hypothetical protein